MFATSASTARGTDLREDGRTRLTELIGAEQAGYRRTRDEYKRVRAQVEAMSRRAGARDERVLRAQRKADRLAPLAGFAPLEGAGVEVGLDDAPADRSYPDRVHPDDLVVHESDVQAVVNALWAGGATGMQIMDQRVIGTSAVRCVGNTLILQGVVYSPPFTITAVGDPGRLRAALASSPGVALFKRYVREYGLGYKVGTVERARLPAYTGDVRLNHATVPGSRDSGT